MARTFVAGNKKQVWTSLDEDLYAELERLCEKEQRTMSSMAAILLTSALKERTRQRKKNAKEV